MWADYDVDYSAALRDENFLAWREAGARRKAQNVVRVCRRIKVQSAIEIGCGTGAVLRNLQELGFAARYACADVSAAAVQHTQQSCGIPISDAFVGSANNLPFQDAAFDAAILSHVVEHLNEPVAALWEASRVARYVIVEVPTEEVLSNFIRTKVLKRPYASIEGAGHVQFWSPSSVESFLRRDCAFEILGRHRDLIDKELEYFGKKGVGLAKPFLKQTLKAAVSAGVYARLLTTHVTFLCRKPVSSQHSSNDRSI
jgi:SAM-dependent methyltransferase